MIDWREKFDEAVLRICNYTNLDNRLPREYLPGIALLPREMHMIDAVLRHPGITPTELSGITGVPKSMVSKMSRKFEKKGIICRYRLEDNQKEVHYQGTDLGKEIFAAHIRFHLDNDWRFYDYFSSLPQEKKEFLVEALDKYATYMESMFKEHEIAAGADCLTDAYEESAH